MKFIVEEAVTRKILCRDLAVGPQPQVIPTISGPAMMEFEVPFGDPQNKDDDGNDIRFRAWGQFIHAEVTLPNGTRKIIASCIVKTCTIDPGTSNLKIQAEGFANYGKDMPWIDNYNPIAVDPFEIVQRIWNHMQTQTHGDIGVTVTPASSGTILLPGFGWDGTELVINFFAIFVRAIDFRDCADEMNKLARDIPFDYREISAWNGDRTVVNRTLQMYYPRYGSQRNDLSFRIGENVLGAEPTSEAEIDWISDIIVRGWFPGKVYSSTVSNPDATRFRRTIKEEDASVNSAERAAVWANRRLKRRQIPAHFSKITVDAFHPNAPFGTWECGDEILVQASYPWMGNISEWHRIMSYSLNDDTGSCDINLKHVDAFNYDPIEFE